MSTPAGGRGRVIEFGVDSITHRPRRACDFIDWGELLAAALDLAQPVLQGLRDVVRVDVARTIEVRDGAGYRERPFVCTYAQVPTRHGAAQQRIGLTSRTNECVPRVGSGLRVAVYAIELRVA